MKTVVINFSGNTGKSTIARHLLASRMNNAQIIPVESLNSDGSDGDEAVRGRQFALVTEAINLLDDAVIDVGASNVEDFLAKMLEYKGSHDDFDYFVVPVVPDQKQIKDTIATINALATEIKIPAKKIRVVFNRLDHGDPAEEKFSAIFRYHAAEKKFTLRARAVVHESDIFEKIGVADMRGAAAVCVDELKNMLRATQDQDEKIKIARQIALKRLADGALDELDAVFAELFR